MANGIRRPPLASRREMNFGRTYPRSPRQFAQLEDTDGFRGATPWQPNYYPPGTYVPQYPPGYGPPASPWTNYHSQSGLPPLPLDPYPPGTYVPQWAPPPWSWTNYNSGFPPPPSPGYGLSQLEDTDRLPRPLDILPWAGQGPFGQPQPMLPSPWGDGLPPLLPAGFGTPPQTPLGLPMVNYGGPITPMPMPGPSPFAINSESPFLPPTGIPPWMTPGTPGPDIQPILFAKKYPYENENLAPRPSDWRRDYLPPRRFRFGSRLRIGGADIKVNLEHCHLSPLLLMPNSKMPTMSFDLRSDHPFDPLNLELLTTAGRPFNSTDLSQLATTRPVHRLRFYHPRLPWYIDVRASQPNGVLVGDVLHQIHEKLQRAILPRDFSNTVLDATDRELITDAYRARCDDRVDIMQQGVRRVDFMGSDVILQGFMEGKNGMWLMKTTRFNPNMDG
ncbi:hypothetical protein FB451DRAFT_1230286 [Mycena latifolia]|nr:hypothetical protein FB451DRAFT_1230286 [Mycena latifolia]